jgi:NADPH:quinone reductase
VTAALVCTALIGEDGLDVRSWPVPDELGPTSLRVAVKAASVNFPDVLMIRGLYQASAEPPFVVGTECSGEVLAVGSDVEQYAVGDRVLALVGTGAMVTERDIDPTRQQVHRIPPAMTWAEAASFNLTYGTAYHGLMRRGLLKPGEWVLITGASGGCGSAAIQVAKAAGASVIAVVGGEAKGALARSLGADVVIDHHAVDAVAPLAKAATDGRGVQVVFDNVGGRDIRDLMRCLAWQGRFLVNGFAGGEIPTVALNHTILKNISLIGVAYGMSAIIDPAANAEDFQQLFAWYDEGLVTPAVGAKYPLANGADALRAVWERRAVGKVVVEMPQ